MKILPTFFLFFQLISTGPHVNGSRCSAVAQWDKIPTRFNVCRTKYSVPGLKRNMHIGLLGTRARSNSFMGEPFDQ